MGANCHGFCAIKKLRRDRPNLGQGGLPYLTHGFCRTCDVWIQHGTGFGLTKNRCPCCHVKLSLHPRQSKNKRRYRELRELS